MKSSYHKEAAYFLKKVTRQRSELDVAKCDNYLKRIREIMIKTSY